MSDQDTAPQTQQIEANGLPVTIHTQYVRDISFENPNAPNSLRSGLGAPEMDVSISMDARPLEDSNLKNLYEVGLSISANAKRGTEVVFIAEILYGVTVSIEENVPEDVHHPLLLIEIPKYAFPFARHLLATLTQQGGFPPLLLNPVDFQALYMARFKDDIAAAQRQDATVQ
jgi:preprotein translocase subunit SecB